jgi:hypothetical protein
LKGQPILGMSDEEYERERKRVLAEMEDQKRAEALARMSLQPGLPTLSQVAPLKKSSSGLYAHKAKQSKQEEISKLREKFEEYKRRMAKQLQKQANRSNQLLGR